MILGCQIGPSPVFDALTPTPILTPFFFPRRGRHGVCVRRPGPGPHRRRPGAGRRWRAARGPGRGRPRPGLGFGPVPICSPKLPPASVQPNFIRESKRPKNPTNERQRIPCARPLTDPPRATLCVCRTVPVTKSPPSCTRGSLKQPNWAFDERHIAVFPQKKGYHNQTSQNVCIIKPSPNNTPLRFLGGAGKK